MKTVGIVFVIFLIAVIITAAGILGYKIFLGNEESVISLGADIIENETTEPPVIEKEVEIYKGTSRPVAVMIDNHKSALPQGGINEAYMVYEIIVEGGESRLMALFKGENAEKIGPVRSARHYFLDYAMENDAIYVHYGWSPQAESDIESLEINNINGIFESEKYFWRTKDKSAPHNVATNMESILQVAQNKGYRITSTKSSVLNYVTDEVNLEEGVPATTITIPYSSSNVVEYTYDEQTQRYIRTSHGILNEDWTTGEEITTKNIIITFAKNTTINDGENKGRQTIYNVDNLEGYYITNGKAIQITCEKTTRNSQTIYKDLEGNEIEVNDGNTFVQICPINAKVEIQ